MSVNHELAKDCSKDVEADDTQRRYNYVNEKSLALAQQFKRSFEQTVLRFLRHRQANSSTGGPSRQGGVGLNGWSTA